MIVSINGNVFGYDDAGSGLPVVFLHGFPHDRSLWAQQRTALAPRVRCIAPDLRGFGVSVAKGPYSMDQYADDVVALLDNLDIGPAVFCGLSMGGYIAMALWRRHPERVRGFVFCDTKAGADSEAARANRELLIGVAHGEGAGAVADRMLLGMIGKATRSRQPSLEADVRAMMARQPVAGIVGALGALRDRPDSHETLKSITVPTLVLVGEDDVLTPPSDAQSMLDALPEAAAARMDIIAGAGHVSCLERPAAVTHALAEYLLTLAGHPY